MSALDNARRPGDVVGLWRIVAELGRGGWGTVYAAEHVQAQLSAAIKILSPEVCKHQAAVERFRREARATSAIGHANVIEVYDAGEVSGGSAYYAMELLAGESLAQTLKREGRLPWPRVRHIVLQLCGALAAAHAKGIVHRDVKPANCFRITRGADHDFIKLLDFGVAKILSGEIGDIASLTNTGEFLGTTAFMAPEQILGEKIDHRVDVHAMGVLMYVMLTGSLPYGGTVASQVVVAIVQNTAAALRMVAPEAGIPEALEKVVARALAKEPRKRFQSIGELEAAVAAIAGGQASVAVGVAGAAAGLAEAPTVAAGAPAVAAGASALAVDVHAVTEGAPEDPRTVPFQGGARRVTSAQPVRAPINGATVSPTVHPAGGAGRHRGLWWALVVVAVLSALLLVAAYY